MSKLYDTYLSLKTNEENSDKTIYLFPYGLFLICLDEDAKIATSLLNLKPTRFIKDVQKCGFPATSIEKYNKLLANTSYNFKIIDTTKKISYTFNEYSADKDTLELLKQINSIDPNNISIPEAYSFIETIKKQATLITGGLENE